MAISREEMLMQSIATGEPSNISPVTREEKYLSYIAGESASKPAMPITRKEVFLDKISPSGGSGGGVTIRNQNKTITENGTYTADSGYTGLGTVTVEVASAGGGGGDIDARIDGTLTEVNSGVASIMKSAFSYCGKLTSGNFPNATSIGQYAFSYCNALTSVNSPNVTSIDAYAFQECRALESADFPKVTSIGDNAFKYCSAVTSVNFPNVTSIGVTVFYYCHKLTSVNIPNAPSIGKDSFYCCYVLPSVDLPKVTSINNSAFSGCYSLKAVILRSETMCTLSHKNAFDYCYHILGTRHSTYNPNGDKDGYFYVPRALLSDTDATMDYRRATNWSTYASQFRALEDYTVDGTITGALDPNKI